MSKQDSFEFEGMDAPMPAGGRGTKLIAGTKVPRMQGVLSEHTEYLCREDILEVRKQYTYSITVEQHLFIKSRGGSEFLRELINWFAQREQEIIDKHMQSSSYRLDKTFGYMPCFNDVPMIIDEDKRSPLWATYFWAKEHGITSPRELLNQFSEAHQEQRV